MNTEIILALVILSLGSKVSASGFKNPFNHSTDELKALEAWSPEDLGDKMIYHEIMGSQWAPWNKEEAPKDSFSYKLLAQPELISQNPKISTSLISPKHRDVYIGGIGFALKVPQENIVATFVSDARSASSMKLTPEQTMMRLQLWARNDRGAIRTPDDLIKNSNGHNEVTVTGTIAELNSAVEVEAVVVNCGKDIDLSGLNDDEFETTLEGCLKQSQLKFDSKAFSQVLPLLLDLKGRQYEIKGLKLI